MNKHIRMPAELADKWLAALRSGEYKQGHGALATGDALGSSYSYCCLGVLQMAADGDVERYRRLGEAFGLPSNGWLRDHEVWFTDSSGERTKIPFFPTLGESATEANDVHECSFTEIADAIEATLERLP